jgi:alpha-tubulin suppressor-like RCC1 family protein
MRKPSDPVVKHLSRLTTYAALSALLLSCAVEADDDNDEMYQDEDIEADTELLGQAELALSTVPAGALCLQAVASGTESKTVTVALAAGSSSAQVSLGLLPLGTVTLTASVFNLACASIAGASPTWVADSQVVTLRPGVVPKLSLTLRQNNPSVTNVNFVGNITSITAGYGNTGLVMSDGTTRVAGYWSTLSSGRVLAATSGLTSVAKFLAPTTYAAHGCVLSTSGVVSCFGLNTAGELGSSIAIGSSSGAVAVAGAPLASQLVIGAHHTCELDQYGYVYCWGANGSGQLGRGTTTASATPTYVSLGRQDVLTAGWAHTCGSYGEAVACWGDNVSGQLGDGTTTMRTTPVYLYSVTGTVSLSAGSLHTCAVRGDGTVRCWGNNGSGQLGDGTFVQRTSPVQVPGITDAVEVSAGGSHTCVRRQNGTVACFGDGSYGQLGDGAAQDRATPVTVPDVTGATQIACGSFHSCALLENQTVKCWGWSGDGGLSDGTFMNRYKPITSIVQ